MQKSILIPVDLQVQSLNTLKLALLRNLDHDVRVFLLYPEYLTTSITELLFYSPSKRLSFLISAEFQEAISIIKNRFAKNLLKVQVDLYHGTNTNALRNYIQANGIHEIYIPKNYVLQKKRNSFDIIPFIKKCATPFYELEWHNSANFDTNELNSLFND